ncbi:MAG: YciI family protein [Kofleriaceae bacterium]
MPTYLCLQRNLPDAARPATPPSPMSPSEMQALYAQFAAWQARFATELVDLGGKLGRGRVVTGEPVPDGPLVEVKELVGGYMIVSAADLDAAVAIARACPGLVGATSTVEVIEIHRP